MSINFNLPECDTCKNFGSGACDSLGADPDHECCFNPRYATPVEATNDNEQPPFHEEYFDWLDELAAEDDAHTTFEQMQDDWAMEQYERTTGEVDFDLTEDEVELLDITFHFID